MKDSEVFSGELLCEATATLISVIATIDCVSDPSSPSMELLEAKRAIHNAIVALRGLEPSLPLCHAGARRCRIRSPCGQGRSMTPVRHQRGSPDISSKTRGCTPRAA